MCLCVGDETRHEGKEEKEEEAKANEREETKDICNGYYFQLLRNFFSLFYFILVFIFFMQCFYTKLFYYELHEREKYMLPRHVYTNERNAML